MLVLLQKPPEYSSLSNKLIFLQESCSAKLPDKVDAGKFILSFLEIGKICDSSMHVYYPKAQIIYYKYRLLYVMNYILCITMNLRLRNAEPSQSNWTNSILLVGCSTKKVITTTSRSKNRDFLHTVN